jgi:hypothetical protein
MEMMKTSTLAESRSTTDGAVIRPPIGVPSKVLGDDVISQLLTECASKKEFLFGVRQYAQAGYRIPLVILQFLWGRKS